MLRHLQESCRVSRGRRHFTAMALAALLITPLAAPLRAQTPPAPVTVLAAASLKTVLDGIATDWQGLGHPPINVVYASSSALARQVEAGLAADVFISADRDWMDYLADRNLIQPASRVDLLGNRIVLIAPAGSTLTTIRIAPQFPLAALLGDGRLAIGNVQSVPAGKYGKAALESLGVWNQVEARLAQAENVRAALMLVARGEAPLGIVYGTDAAAESAVRDIGAFPDHTHPPIVYPAGLLAASKQPEATPFFAFLQGSEAAVAFERAGFLVLRR